MMDENNKFLKPVLTPSYSDSYVMRNTILQALTKQADRFQGVLIDIGCGNKPYKPILLSPPSKVVNYIGLDIVGDIYHPPDLYWDGRVIPVKDKSIDCSIATEFLEHCPHPEEVLSEAFRVLKPGGLFFFTVPFFWPLHEAPRDEYRFTPFALERMLIRAGFSDLKLEALGGWDASLAQMLGLWTNRRPMGNKKRYLIRLIVFPMIKFLIGKDRLPPGFEEGLMITGITGTAVK